MATVEKFKFWCNKILPLVYDDSLSYMEFLGKVYEKLNETIDAVNANTDAITEFDQRINEFIDSETAAREGWEDQQERDRQSWEDQQAQKWAAFQAMFISEYDPSEVYAKGDLCSVQYKMYVAKSATTGTFDPTKWDEIVLSDYLADYVSTAAAAMQTQYDGFLADYQRTFGIVQTVGDSTTDAISQDGFTKYGMPIMGTISTSISNFADLPGYGVYGVTPTQLKRLGDVPAPISYSANATLVIAPRYLKRDFIFIQPDIVFIGTTESESVGSAITWRAVSHPTREIVLNNSAWMNFDRVSGNYVTSTATLISALREVPQGTKNIYVRISSGYEFRICWYRYSDFLSYYPSSGYATSDYSYAVGDNSKWFRVYLRKTDGSSITPSDAANISISFTFAPRVLEQPLFYGKILSILGDSLSTYGGSIDAAPADRISDGTWTYAGNRCRYPQTNLLANVADTYWYKIMQRFNMSLGVNDSWAGSRVSWDGHTESADIGADKYIGSQTRIDHLGSNGTPHLILINAGTNDISHAVTIGTFNTEDPTSYTDEQVAALPVNTFADAVRTLLIRLTRTYRYTTFVYILPNYTTSSYTLTEADEYNEIIKTACDFFGIKWIDARTSGVNFYNRSVYLPDGTHYNEQGMDLLYKNVVMALESNF